MQYTKELVVAAHARSLNWLTDIPAEVKKTIYRKGQKTNSSDEIFMEKNVGRCVHTFFSHIYNRYDTLAQYTYFVQDYPFDHWLDVIECLNYSEIDMKKTATIQCGGYYGYVNFGTVLQPASQVGDGIVFKCMTGNGIDVDRWYRMLFLEEPPEIYEFNPGGHFVITKEHVHLRNKEFYKQVIDILEADEIAPYGIERLENYIFNPKFETHIK